MAPKNMMTSGIILFAVAAIVVFFILWWFFGWQYSLEPIPGTSMEAIT